VKDHIHEVLFTLRFHDLLFNNHRLLILLILFHFKVPTREFTPIKFDFQDLELGSLDQHFDLLSN